MDNNKAKKRITFNLDEETNEVYQILLQMSPYNDKDDFLKYLFMEKLEHINKSFKHPLFNLENLKEKKKYEEWRGQRNISKIQMSLLTQPRHIQNNLHNLEQEGDFEGVSFDIQIKLLDSILEECRITENVKSVDVLKDFIYRTKSPYKKELLKKCDDYRELIKREKENQPYKIGELADNKFLSKENGNKTRDNRGTE